MNSNYNWSDNRVIGTSNPNNASFRRVFPSPDTGDTAGMDSGGTAMTGMSGTTMVGMQGGSMISTTPMMGSASMMSEQGPPPATDRSYIPGYLSSIIGKNIRAEFVMGSNIMTDRTGILREVGTNYFVLEDAVTHARIMCDLYSVKFVTTL